MKFHNDYWIESNRYSLSLSLPLSGANVPAVENYFSFRELFIVFFFLTVKKGHQFRGGTIFQYTNQKLRKEFMIVIPLLSRRLKATLLL